MAIKRILVIGGSGYIGKVLVKELNKKYDVGLFDRSNGDDLLNKKSLEKIKGFDFVIDLASVVRSLNKKKYEENLMGLKNLIKSLSKSKTRLIYFSTQNVNLKNKGPYAKSKLDCERRLKNSSLKYMIIRPNYVYSIDKRNEFYKMAWWGKKFGVVPIIGSGNNKIQPVLREDLVKIIVKLINEFKNKKIVEISGTESYSLNQIAGLISQNLNKKIKQIHVSFRLIKLFEFIFPFDISGADEDRLSLDWTGGQSSFKKDLKKIVGIVTGKV